MTEDTQNNPWPLPRFYFMVTFNGVDIPFQEVTGLESETQAIEYRQGQGSGFSTIQMPGLAKGNNVVLKNGTISNNTTFWNWYSQVKMNTIQRQNVQIKLLDEAGQTTMSWELLNAWPAKISGTELKSDETEVTIEMIELAHEGISIKQTS